MSDDRRAKWLSAGLDPANPIIGGSRAPIVLGLSHWMSRFELHQEMVGALPPEDRGDNINLTRGTVLEPVVLRLLAMKTGRLVEAAEPYTRVFHPEHTWLACTPDGWEWPHDAESWGGYNRGIVQAKTALSFSKSDWDDENSDTRQNYWTQLQHEMLATGCSWGTLCVLFVDLGTLTRLVNTALCMLDEDSKYDTLADAIADTADFRWFDFEADAEFQADLLATEQAFIDAVKSGNTPATDASESCSRCLKRLHPRDTGGEVMLPAEFSDMCTALRDSKVEVKELEKQISDMENRIKAAIGDATYGVLPDGSRFSWRTQQRKEYVCKATEVRVLRFEKGK